MSWEAAESALRDFIGNRGGFVEHRPFVRYLRTQVALQMRVNDPDVDDVVQAVLIRLEKALGGGRAAPDNLRSFVHTTIRSAVIDNFRKRSREPQTLPLNDLQDQDGSTATSVGANDQSAPGFERDFEAVSDPEVSENAKRAAVGRILAEVLGRRDVPEEILYVIQLRILGLNYREIGEITGEKENTVEQRIHRFFKEERRRRAR